MGRFDLKLIQKSSALGAIAIAVAAGLALAVGAITGDLGNGARELVARVCVLVPALAALGSALAVRYARARGELRPLEALGVHPLRLVLPALGTAWIFGFGASLALTTPLVESAVLFPAIPWAPAWELGEARARAPGLGIEIDAGGFVVQSSARSDRETHAALRPQHSQASAGWLLVPMAVLLPPWGVARMPRLLRLFSGGLTLGLQILLFHLAALAAIPPLLYLFGAAPLFAALVLHIKWRR